MSLDNFIPTVWSSKLLKQLDRKHVLVDLCNRDYEGDIANKGDTVKINSIGDISVSDYTKNSTSISPENLSDASTQLTIDQSKYFAFEVDDIDKMQSNIDYTNRAMDKASLALADTADTYVAGLYSNAGKNFSATDWSSDSNINIKSVAGAIKETLMKNDVPANANIWWVVTPEIYTDFIYDKISESTDNVSELETGQVGRLYGMDIYVSNNLSGDGTSGTEYETLAGTGDAIAYAEQMNKVEAYRPEDSFADAVKGLHLYGAKVIRPKQLVNYPIQTS